MLNVAGHESHLSSYPIEPCQKCRILQPYGDQEPSAGSSQEKKTDPIWASCELPKEHMCYLEKLTIWMLGNENLFWELLSAFQIWPLGIYDLSRETRRCKNPCLPLELLHLLKGEVMEKQCDSPLVSWHSHLDHARKSLRVSCEFLTWWSFPIQLALHSDIFTFIYRTSLAPDPAPDLLKSSEHKTNTEVENLISQGWSLLHIYVNTHAEVTEDNW